MAEKSRLEGRRVTYDDIHKVTGIFPSTLSRLAAGQGKRVDLAVLERLCQYFDCEPGDLLVLQPALTEGRDIRSRSRTDRGIGRRSGPPTPQR